MSYMEVVGRGWREVPVPGKKPLPRIITDDEYFPLHVGLFPDEKESRCKYREHPHKHIRFMGDDGNSGIWAPIESKPFFDHVFNWFISKEKWMYGASMENIRKALERDRAELLEFMTPRERSLINDQSKWAGDPVGVWVMLE